MNLPMSGEQAELDEMVAAAAGAKLRPGAVLVLLGDRADVPIRVQNLMLAAVLERGPDSKARLGLDGPRQAVLVTLQVPGGNIQHRHLHAAGDVHAHRVGNHRVFGGQHPADRETVADVGIGHQGPRHGHWQQAGPFHLHHGLVLQSFAPLAVFDRLGAWRWRSVQQGFGKFASQAVLRESRQDWR